MISLIKENKKRWIFPSLVVLMRVLFGVGWLLAGITKLTEKSWFKEPGVFLTDYLLSALEKPNVPLFYKIFIEEAALEYVMTLNYIIPIFQITVGLFIIIGFMTIPSLSICLFMHINFILSGNMNVMSLVLYTSAFTLIIFRDTMYYASLDRLFNLETLFMTNIEQENKSIRAKKEKLLGES